MVKLTANGKGITLLNTDSISLTDIAKYTIEQLLVLNNLQNANAEMIKQGLPQSRRLKKLNKITQNQRCILLRSTQKACRGSNNWTSKAK